MVTVQVLSQVCWGGLLQGKAIKHKYFLQKVKQGLTLFRLVESPILLLTEGIHPIKAMLTAIRGSSQGIKEEIFTVRKEADTRFLNVIDWKWTRHA